MEVITIESKAFAALVEKIDGIAAYVEESRQREQDGQPHDGQVDDGQRGVRISRNQPPHLATLPHEPDYRLLHLREENPLPPHGRGAVPGTVDAGNARQADRPDDRTTPFT